VSNLQAFIQHQKGEFIFTVNVKIIYPPRLQQYL